MAETPPILSGIRTEMKHLAERQRVIAQNVANSETPGYKAREVEGPDFSALVASTGSVNGKPMVARPRVELTTAMQAMGARPPQGAGGVILDRDITETKPDGNNVTLEDQLMKMGELQADFTAMTNIYRRQLSLLKTAIGRGGA